jgi:hypothetical protein
MRDRFDSWLLIAMFLSEFVRGIIDIRKHIRWLQKQIAEAKEKGDFSTARHLLRHAHEWAACGALCAIAAVPVLYYGSHIPLV